VEPNPYCFILGAHQVQGFQAMERGGGDSALKLRQGSNISLLF